MQAHPGAHVLELADVFNLSHPTVLYHVRILEDEGYVQTILAGKRRCAFDTAAHFNSWERDVLVLLQSEAGRVLEFVVENPGTFPRELAKSLGVSETTVKRAVPELLRLGLVEESVGFRKRLALAAGAEPRARALLARLPASEARIRLDAILAREEGRREAAEKAEADALEEEARNRLFPR